MRFTETQSRFLHAGGVLSGMLLWPPISPELPGALMWWGFPFFAQNQSLVLCILEGTGGAGLWVFYQNLIFT